MTLYWLAVLVVAMVATALMLLVWLDSPTSEERDRNGW